MKTLSFLYVLLSCSIHLQIYRSQTCGPFPTILITLGVDFCNGPKSQQVGQWFACSIRHRECTEPVLPKLCCLTPWGFYTGAAISAKLYWWIFVCTRVKQPKCAYLKLGELRGAGLLPPHTATRTAQPATSCGAHLAQFFPFNSSGTIKAA